MKHRPVITLEESDPAEPITPEERERIEREPLHPELLRIINERSGRPIEKCISLEDFVKKQENRRNKYVG